MRAISVAVGVVLLIPTIGSVSRSAIRNSAARSQTGHDEPIAARMEEVRSIHRDAKRHVAAGQYIDAARLFERGYQRSLALGKTSFALPFLTNLANCHLALYQFRPAMEAATSTK